MLIVGVGGTPREDSSSERALGRAIDAVNALGAETRMFGGQDLAELGYYAPGAALTSTAVRLLDAISSCDGLIVATPSYHGSISGLVKNALDHVEELRLADRPYLQDRAVGCIVTSGGVHGVGTTLTTLRSIIHALRGWPTPFGLALNGRTSPAPDPALLARESDGVDVLAAEVVRFARAVEGGALGNLRAGAVSPCTGPGVPELAPQAAEGLQK